MTETQKVIAVNEHHDSAIELFLFLFLSRAVTASSGQIHRVVLVGILIFRLDK